MALAGGSQPGGGLRQERFPAQRNTPAADDERRSRPGRFTLGTSRTGGDVRSAPRRAGGAGGGGPRDLDPALCPGLQRQRDRRHTGNQCYGGAHAAEPRPPTPGRTPVGPGSRESAMKTLHSRNLDDVLRDFYRSEMPAPWPALEAPAPAPTPVKKPQRVRFRAISRLALAAAVAFLLIGYLAFAS